MCAFTLRSQLWRLFSASMTLAAGSSRDDQMFSEHRTQRERHSFMWILLNKLTGQDTIHTLSVDSISSKHTSAVLSVMLAWQYLKMISAETGLSSELIAVLWLTPATARSIPRFIQTAAHAGQQTIRMFMFWYWSRSEPSVAVLEWGDGDDISFSLMKRSAGHTWTYAPDQILMSSSDLSQLGLIKLKRLFGIFYLSPKPLERWPVRA